MRKGIQHNDCVYIWTTHTTTTRTYSKAFIRFNPKMISSNWTMARECECEKYSSLRHLQWIQCTQQSDLMLILMYGILMNVCCCSNSVLNLSNGLHIVTNWLRSQKGSASFHYFTRCHCCKDELLLFSYFMELCAAAAAADIVCVCCCLMTIVQSSFGEAHGYNGYEHS